MSIFYNSVSFYNSCLLLCNVTGQVKHPIADDMNSGLYEAMRKELRHAVEEIKTELEQVCYNLAFC